VNLLDGLDDEPAAPAGGSLLDGLDDDVAPAAGSNGVSLQKFDIEPAPAPAARAPAAAPPDRQPSVGMRALRGLSKGFLDGAGFVPRLVGEAANVVSPPYDADAIAQPGPRMQPEIAAGKVDADPAGGVRRAAAWETGKDALMTAASMNPYTRVPMMVGGLGMQAYNFAQNPSVEGAAEAVGGFGGGMIAGKALQAGGGALMAKLRPPKLGVVPFLPDMSGPGETDSFRVGGSNAVPQPPMHEVLGRVPPELTPAPAPEPAAPAAPAPEPAAAPTGPSAAAQAIEQLRARAAGRQPAHNALADLESELRGASLPNPGKGPPVTGLEEPVPSSPTPRTVAASRPAMIAPDAAQTPDVRVLPHEPVARATLIDRGTGELTEPGQMTKRTFTSQKESVPAPTAQTVTRTRAARLGPDDLAGEEHAANAGEPTPTMLRETMRTKQPGNLPQPVSIEARYGPGARVLRGHTVIRGDPSEVMIPAANEVPAGSPEEQSAWMAHEIVDRVLGEDARTITPDDGAVVANVMNGKASPSEIELFQQRPDLKRFAWRLGKLQSEAPERFKGEVVGGRNPWEMVSKDILGLSSDDQMAPALERLARQDPTGTKPTPNYGVPSRDFTQRPPNALTGLRAQAVAAAHTAVGKPAARAQAVRAMNMLAELRAALKARVESEQKMNEDLAEATQMSKKVDLERARRLATVQKQTTAERRAQEEAGADGPSGLGSIAKKAVRGMAGHVINMSVPGLGQARAGQYITKGVDEALSGKGAKK
jgi:hypothetical protein